MTNLLSVATNLKAFGISAIPVTGKKSNIPWKAFQSRTPDDKELKQFFAKAEGIAMVGGAVQCLDFDDKHAKGIFYRFAKRAEETGLDYLIGELIRQRTPSGGVHLVWKCEGGRLGNEKLASRPATEEERKAGEREKTMIETRGDGGYFLIAPSPGYELEQGDWSSIPVISEEDRDALLALARTFDERQHEHHEPAPHATISDLTPGDDFDARADIPALLKNHGWRPCGSSGNYWTRPGKQKGISATWNVVPNRFYVFTSSTQFEPNHVYRPWHVYAMLECGGDFSKAAAELRRQGFGSERKKAKEYQPGIEPTPEDPPGIEGCDPMAAAPTTESETDKIRRLINARRFDRTKRPGPIKAVYSLGGVIISTSGNLTAITAQAKVGKSALVTAFIAAAMMNHDFPRDCLSAQSENKAGKALLYLDTEQSPDDFWHSVDRATRRSGLTEEPEWIRAFTTTDLPVQIARKSLAIEMADAAAQFGGIHSVIIDGAADLVLDVNDAEECNAFVAELHGMAIRYDCPIICVIHKNPGSDKTRGHLGSQIERKAESNLTLEKDDEVTVVWSGKQRRAPILKKNGPRFAWDDDLKMHVTVQEADPVTQKVREWADLAKEAIKPGESLSWKALVAALTDARRTPDATPTLRTVERWIKAMKSARIIENRMGNYYLTQEATAL